MDNSHVSLVAVSLRSGGFDHFRCDRPISLGFNAANMGKILKCAGNDDIITLKAEDEGDALTMMFESPNGDRIADFGELYMSCVCIYNVVMCHWAVNKCWVLILIMQWQRYGGSMKGCIAKRRHWYIRDDRCHWPTWYMSCDTYGAPWVMQLYIGSALGAL